MREQLAQALEANYPEQAAMVKDTTTTLQVLETPFFQKHKIILAKKFMPHRQWIGYFALRNDGRATDIYLKKPAFEAVAAVDGMELGTVAQATAYMQLAWEVTHSRTELTYLVNSPADFRFRPNLEPELQARREALEAKYGPIIQPMTLVPQGKNFQATYYQVANRNLERVTAQLRATGEFHISAELLEADMPTVWGL